MSYSCYFLINGSLKMSAGKVAVSVAHVAQLLVETAMRFSSQMGLASLHFRMQEYLKPDQLRKIVLVAKDEVEMFKLASFDTTTMVFAQVVDLGHYEVPAGSLTCVGLFGKTEDLKKKFKGLKLYK